MSENRDLTPLMAIVDADVAARAGWPILDLAAAYLRGGVRLIQLRAKSMPADAYLATASALVQLARRYSESGLGVPAQSPARVIVNDRADIARLAQADGVHVGQDDLPVALVRQAFPGLRVGLSTHDSAQVEQAIAEAPDYLAVGPIFATASKEDPSPVVGVAALRELVARCRKARPGLPIVAIGGVTLETAGEIGAIVDAVAVIGALLPDGGLSAVEERARALHATILGERR